MDIGKGPTCHGGAYVVQVLESLGLGALAKQLKKGEWVDVPITQEPQVEALKKYLG